MRRHIHVRGDDNHLIDLRQTAENSQLPADFVSDEQLNRLGGWFIKMRWLACFVATVLVILAIRVLGYLEEELLVPLAISIACLVASNIAYSAMLKRGRLTRFMLAVQIYTDLVILTIMLHFSGGIENPASFAYLFHVIIGGILFDRRRCYVIVLVASLLFSALAFAESGGLLHHYTLLVFPHAEEEGKLTHASYDMLFVATRVLLQFSLMSLTAYFTTTIMDRVRSEERRALAERQRLERVVQATGAGLAIMDRNHHVVWMNDQIKKWLKLSDDQLSRSTVLPETWTGGQTGPVEKTFKDGFVREVERQLTGDGGGRRFFQVTIAPLIDSAGRIYQVAELTQDITERKMVDAQMMHSAKMAVLGFMAAGIAHEVRNPLASISIRLQLLEQQHDDAFLKESVSVLREQISRIDRIVHGVSQFARPTKDEWSVCRINDLLGEVLNVLRLHTKAKNLQVEADFANGIPDTMGVKDQLIQVFLNLGLNAIEAMPHGGSLTIRSYAGTDDIRIEFKDTGQGMTDEVKARVFDPFFSTKEHGLGLGLSLAHNMVDAHGGRIHITSSPGNGATFTVILPVRTHTAERRPA